jgi:hypothetical protein
MMTIKYGLQFLFFKLADNDGQNFLLVSSSILFITQPTATPSQNTCKKLSLSIKEPLVEGEKTGDGVSYAPHVKIPNPLKARATNNLL